MLFSSDLDPVITTLLMVQKVCMCSSGMVVITQWKVKKLLVTLEVMEGKTIVFPSSNTRGRVWVEDFLESASSALEKIKDHCR
ncbi:hypothetical protein M2129_002204 [Polynucleobacter sphagniphilus]|nr:hypothetical protein [Polynucleobacter sphagniphilus]